MITVGEDALASGAYMVASATDKIYVNAGTITGSIGVLMEGFGYQGLMKKIGVTSRLFAVGKHKTRLDPFQPLKADDVKKVKAILADAHQHFIAMVKQGRGNRLKGSDSKLFSGDFWLGDTAIKLGLADGLGNLYSVMKKEFKVSDFVDYSNQPSLLHNFIKGVGSEVNFAFVTQGQQPHLLARQFS